MMFLKFLHNISDAGHRISTEWAGSALSTALVGLAIDQPELVALAIAGVSGAYANAVWFPLDTWRKRVAQGIASSLMSLCLGGAGGFIMNSVFDTGVWGFAFWGFLFAASGKEGIAMAKAIFVKR